MSQSTLATMPSQTVGSSLERLVGLGEAGRLAAYRSNQLSSRELWLWARRFPTEVPTVNGELEWIALGLADLD